MDKQTIETYDLLAKEYDDETIDFWERFPRDFIDAFAFEVGEGSVLNVGSGPGRDGLMLQEKGLTLTCVDASKAMVELSTARGLTSVEGDFMHLPFKDESFDGVWSYTALLHIPKSEVGKAIEEIVRVLKPNGTFGLGLIEGEGESYRESSGVGQPRWFAYYQEPEMLDLLASHGFEMKVHSRFQPKSKPYLHFLGHKKA